VTEEANNKIDLDKAIIQELEMTLLKQNQLRAHILRLDLIHPVLSGNKWFKLKYYMDEIKEKNFKKVLTFGGAFSNHIIATAFAAKQSGIESIGIIRGEKPATLSHTLKQAAAYGMKFKFVDRKWYASKSEPENKTVLQNEFNDAYIIPEGGAGKNGIKGSKEILLLTPKQNYTHIVCAIGTGTMYLGLVNSSVAGQEIIGITILKGMNDMMDELIKRIEDPLKIKFCKIFYEYHFGGYAKKSSALFHFMNSFYQQTTIPTDFVYTGKLFFAFNDLVGKKYFAPGSKILLIHSGGLQGNQSLPPGNLLF